MYSDLPQALKQQVYKHLRANDFITAKAVHDTWYENKTQLSPSN
ncbi:MAG: hypothetical protein CL816_02135 [Coxiellaceae bacterium]|nr:hypothetical protein [Coxiellaceae bacterium]